VVFNENIGKNRDGAWRKIDSPEVLRFAQDDRVFYRHQHAPLRHD
jgi:hypothetical protein